MKHHDLQFLDKTQDIAIFDQRQLPHWLQAGTLCFITWRVADSLPRKVLAELDAKIDQLLLARKLDRNVANCEEWASLDAKGRSAVHWKMFRIRDAFLDRGLERCPLRHPAHAAIVKESLLQFDEQRYFLTDMVIMPNHVHLIAAFENNASMLKQCTTWKRFSGRKVNAAEGTSGEFWQVDQFDHLIRGGPQFEHFRWYIWDNPRRAGLKEGEFVWWQKSLGSRKTSG